MLDQADTHAHFEEQLEVIKHMSVGGYAESEELNRPARVFCVMQGIEDNKNGALTSSSLH